MEESALVFRRSSRPHHDCAFVSRRSVRSGASAAWRNLVVNAQFMAENLDSNGVVVDIGRALEVLKAILAPLNYVVISTRLRNSKVPTPPPNS